MTSSLLHGFKEFRKSHYDGASKLMEQLVKDGQSPDYFIISCIDSRSNPGPQDSHYLFGRFVEMIAAHKGKKAA